MRLIGFVVLATRCALGASALNQCGRFNDGVPDLFCRVEQTLENLRAILNETKSIQKAEDQDHTYDDKYSLVEFVTLNTWQSLDYAFTLLDLNLTKIAIQSSKTGEEIFLNFRGETECNLISEQEVDVKGDAIEVSSSFGSSTTSRKLHKVTEYKWQVSESYHLYLCFGSCNDKRLDLKNRTMSSTVVTTTKTTKPTERPRVYIAPPLKISWLLNRILLGEEGLGTFHFKIDRNVDSCKTPSRNNDIENVLKVHNRLATWLTQLDKEYFESIYTPPQSQGPRLEDVFWGGESGWYTNVPFLENSTLLTADRVSLLHAKQREGLSTMLSEASKVFAPARPDLMVSFDEASLLIALRHLRVVLLMHEKSVEYVENMLRNQLVQAIGKEIDAQDFSHYMKFHAIKFFPDELAPRPFSTSIRQGNSTPVGSFSIEEITKNGEEPIQLLSRRISGKGKLPIRIHIDAATHIEITGDRVLSGWIRFQFDSFTSQPFTRLAVRARQFSSLILMVGTVTGSHSFDPKSAIILKNKDEVLIPILTESLPSAKEFKDAISSLSPEQQRFARSFRTMQLESSVFGICVVQLKPQLEKLLNLPPGALAKEIQLTEDLTSLFVEYHIPADLLSFDGEASLNTTGKVALVKEYVHAVNDVVKNARQQVLQEEKEKAKSRLLMKDEPLIATADFATFSVQSSESRSFRSASSARKTTLRGSESQGPSSGGTEFSSAVDDERQGERMSQTGEPSDLREVDFTTIPRTLDTSFEQHDTDGYCRTMVIKTQDEWWTMKRKKNLLVDAVDSSLASSQIRSEKNRAFDLLDAITRSGSLAIEAAELHVLIGVSHNFVNSVLKTLYVDNINPIEKAEKSLIMLGAEIFGKQPKELVRGKSNLARLVNSFPDLMTD